MDDAAAVAVAGKEGKKRERRKKRKQTGCKTVQRKKEIKSLNGETEMFS